MFWFIPIILAGAVGGIAGGLATILICGIIDLFSVDETVRERAQHLSDAFKYRIKEAKKNAVDVGIFDRETNELETITLTSESCISDEVRKDVMKWYYL
jgi:hypothetical protein